MCHSRYSHRLGSPLALLALAVLTTVLAIGCVQLRDRPFIGSILTTQMCPPQYTCVLAPVPEPTPVL